MKVVYKIGNLLDDNADIFKDCDVELRMYDFK